MRSNTLLFLALTSILAGSLVAQSRLPNHRISNHPTWFNTGGFGDYIHGLSDMDGDGWADYAVSAPNHDPAVSGFGSVYVVSGRTSAFILQIDGTQASSAIGQNVCDVPDLNGDGQRDLIIASPTHNVTGVGNNTGRIRAHSGSDGAVIWTYDGTTPGGNLGVSMGTIGTTSTVSSIVAGETGYATPGIGPGAGRVVYIDAQTGLFQDDEEGQLAFQGFGRSIAAKAGLGGMWVGSALGRLYTIDGPFVGDGTPNLVEGPVPGSNGHPRLALLAGTGIGASGLAVGRHYADPNGQANGGTITWHGGGSGSGTVIYSGTQLENAGQDCIAVRDWDGDGNDEIGFSAIDPNNSTGVLFRIMDTGGTILESITRAPGGQHFSSIPDVTGDGRGELLVGMSAGLSLEYEATLFAQGLGAPNFTTGTGGSLVIDQTIGMTPAHGGALYAQAYSATGASPGVIVQTGAPLIPLTPDGLTQTGIALAGSSFIPDAVGNLDVNGFKTTTMNIDGATAASLTGVSIYTAVAVFSPTLAVAATTNPREITFP